MFKFVLPAMGLFVSVLCIPSANAAPVRSAVTPLSYTDAFSSNWFVEEMRNIYADWNTSFSPDGSQLAYVLCDGKRREAAAKAAAKKESRAEGIINYFRRGCEVWVTSTKQAAGRKVASIDGDSWGPAWSPDGKQLAFYAQVDGRAQLWLWDAQRSSSRTVGAAQIRTTHFAHHPLWLNDEQVIVHLTPERELPLEKELQPKSAAESQDNAASEDASTVVVLKPLPEKLEWGRWPTETREPYSFDRMGLGIVSVVSGEVRRIAPDAAIDQMWLSPDRTQLLYAHQTVIPAKRQVTSARDFVVVDVRTGKSRVLLSNVWQDHWELSMASWSPDGQWIAYLSSIPDAPESQDREVSNYKPGVHGDLYVVASQGGTPRKLQATQATQGFGFQVTPLWRADSDSIDLVGEGGIWRGSVSKATLEPVTFGSSWSPAAVIPIGNEARVWTTPSVQLAIFARDPRSKQNGIWVMDAAGKWKLVQAEDKEYGSTPRVCANGKSIVYAAQSASHPNELWAVTSGFSTPVKLTHSNPDLSRYTLGESRLIEYRGQDGTPLKAALLLPAGYQPGKRYPLLTYVYASKLGSNQLNLYAIELAGQYNMQLLATRGYAVLLPDIPVGVGTPVKDIMNSVMPAIDKVVDLGIADENALAVSGQSNGGYTTLVLITQTNRFKAAIMNAGPGHLTSMWGMMQDDGGGMWHGWFERRSGAMGVKPWENPQRYVENSPIYYLDRVQTPLLMQAGADDRYVVPNSDEVFVGLGRLGKDVTYLRYRGEGHLLGKKVNMIDYWQRVFAFLEQHLPSI